MVERDMGSRPADASGIDAPRGDSSLPDTGIRIDSAVVDPDMGSTPDANVVRPDMGPRDAMIGRDVGSDSGCTSAAQCTDGLACNGTERCEFGRCVAGAAVVCDDGVTCTVDACSEPGTCRYTPNDLACPMGQSCTPTGCRAGGCAETPCRLTPTQCGCAAGEGCYVAGSARVCATAGAGTSGAACTTNADCAIEYECVNFSRGTTPATMCAHMCATDAGCAGGLCIYTLNDGAGGTVPGVTLCSRPCDPVNQTGCPAGLFCTVFQEAAAPMRYFSDCTAPPGGGTQFTPCGTDADCAAGFACINGGLGLQCSHWCRVPGGACSGGAVCTGFTAPPIMLGAVEIGVCI